MTQFIHLRTHSEYSMVDGLLRVKELVSQVTQYGMPAVALTDEFNLFALVKFIEHVAQCNPSSGRIVGSKVLMASVD